MIYLQSTITAANTALQRMAKSAAFCHPLSLDVSFCESLRLDAQAVKTRLIEQINGYYLS